MSKECMKEKMEKLTTELAEIVSKAHVTTDPYEIEAATGEKGWNCPEEHIAQTVSIRPKTLESEGE